MAGELILVRGTPKILETNGASCANNAIVQANDAAYSILADGANYPHARFVIVCAFGVAPTENSVLELRPRPINIISTNDSEVPEAAGRFYRSVGGFTLNNVTSIQYIELIAFNVPWEAEYYLHNRATGQTMYAGWTLTVTPFTFKSAT